VGKKSKPTERIKKKLETHGDISMHPCEDDDRRGYKQFITDQKITITEALNKIGMSTEEVARFNFGNDLEGYSVDNYEQCFVLFGIVYLGWQKEPGFSGKPLGGFDGLTGEGGNAWFWVPGECKLDPDPDPDGAYFGDLSSKEENDRKKGRDVPPFKRDKKYYAVRSEAGADGVWATCTVDTGIKPGDILLSHHSQDDFICRLTLSWPTHAGIALNEMWAVDADKRGDDADGKPLNAVDYITLMHFFAQKDNDDTNIFWHRDDYPKLWPRSTHYTPTGAAVYRYVGRPGTRGYDRNKIESVCHKAAEWAKEQTGNQYTFSLKSSTIIGKKKGFEKLKIGPKIVEKDFDAKGYAIDEKGQRATRYSKSEKRLQETESHSIYCAELVWRAYRKAGVNIVDPKKLANLFEDSSHGVAAVLKHEMKYYDETLDQDVERWPFEEIDAKADVKKDERDQAWQDLKGRKKLEKLRGLGPVIQKSLIWAGLRKARVGIKMVPAGIARKILIAFMKKKTSGYFCAPYQLAKSKLTKRVAALWPVWEQDDKGNFKNDTVELTDFRKQDLHPYKVLEALSTGTTTDKRAGWKDFADKNGQKIKVSVWEPWADIPEEEPVVPDLKMDVDEAGQKYNTPVKYKGPQKKPPFMP